MKYIKTKYFMSLVIAISIFILNAVPIQASTKEILTYVDYVNTPSGAVGIGATLTVQQSYGGYIIEIKNPFLSNYYEEIDPRTISLTDPTVWASGSYATVTVTYLYEGSQVQETCIFYP